MRIFADVIGIPENARTSNKMWSGCKMAIFTIYFHTFEIIFKVVGNIIMHWL